MEQNYAIAILFLFLISGIVFRQFKKIYFNKVKLEGILLSYVFMLGAFELSGIPSPIIKWLNEFLNLLLFIKVLNWRLRNNKTILLPFLGLFIILSSVFWISFSLTNSDLIDSFFAYRFYFSPILFFWAIYNYSYSEYQIRCLNGFILFLFSFQLPAQFVKTLFYGGFVENPVGSIIRAGGGVASYIPLIALTLFISLYLLYRKEKRYLIYPILFMYVGIASQKRAAFYFIPLIAIYYALVYRKITTIQIRKNKWGSLITMFILVPILVFLGAIYNPIIRRETRGNITLESLIEHAEEYNNQTTASGEAVGRFSSFRTMYEKIKKESFNTILFGYGPSTVKGYDRGDGKFEQFDIYGSFPGWVYQFVQVGLLGCLFYFLIYFRFYRSVMLVAKREPDPYWKVIEITILTTLFLLLIDFVIYGITFLTVYAFTYSISYFVAVIMKRKYMLPPNHFTNS